MSTHSTQSNHSTISTDSTGYGWTCAFTYVTRFSVSFSHSFSPLPRLSYYLVWPPSSIVSAAPRIWYQCDPARTLPLETSVSYIGFSSSNNNSLPHSTTAVLLCIPTFDVDFYPRHVAFLKDVCVIVILVCTWAFLLTTFSFTMPGAVQCVQIQRLTYRRPLNKLGKHQY